MTPKVPPQIPENEKDTNAAWAAGIKLVTVKMGTIIR
jgi:hypothetical protein